MQHRYIAFSTIIGTQEGHSATTIFYFHFSESVIWGGGSKFVRVLHWTKFCQYSQWMSAEQPQIQALLPSICQEINFQSVLFAWWCVGTYN